jgi:hypothetical protein
MTHWECPCGHARSKSLNGAKPERTLVSLREPLCSFCGDAHQPDYERPAATAGGRERGLPAAEGRLYQRDRGYWDADAHAAVLAREER